MNYEMRLIIHHSSFIIHPLAPVGGPMQRTLLAFLALAGSMSAQFRVLSFYEAPFTSSAPKLDGHLDEPCWALAPPHTSYYKYFVPNPPPGELRTEHRLLHDEHGLYVAVINYEEHPDKLRIRFTDRDNPNLWTDDCAELYIDCHGNGIGFRKFVITAGGTMGDSMRVDGAVILDDWSGDSWHAKTSIESDRWTIEAFFPWSDLGGRPQPDALWMFCHVRYAFSSGKFVGVTSSAGGNYSNPGDFGYLAFQAGATSRTPAAVGELLGTRAVPPWGLAIGEQLLFNTGGSVQNVRMADLLAQEQRNLDSLRQEVEKLLSEQRLKEKFQPEYDALAASLPSTSADPMTRLTGLAAASGNLRALLARIRLEFDFN